MKNFLNNVTTKATKLVVLLGIATVLFSCQKDEITSDATVESTIAKDAIYEQKSTCNLEVTTFAELPGSFNDGVTVDRWGNSYVSEFGQFIGANGNGTTVFKIKKNGEVSTFVTALLGPLGSAFDRQGNFYVTHNNNGGGNGDVLKIAPDGTKELFATIDGFPAGLALDRIGNVYVSNFVSPTIFKINRDGEVSEFATDPRLAGTVGIDFDRRGNLIVGNYGTADILSVDRKGEVSLIATIPDIAFGGAAIGGIEVVGNTIFATGIVVNKIFKVTMNGEVAVFAGNGEATSIDGPLLESSFIAPNRIEFDRRSRSLLISQYGANGLRKIRLH